LGQRSRKRRPAGGAAAAGKAPRGGAAAAGKAPRDDATRRGYARSRERDAAVRAALEPYAPGERPLAIKISTAVCALIAIANPVLHFAGWEVSGRQPTLLGTLALCALLAAAAVGMWRMRYWAVLGFEMLLGITLVYAGLSLLVPSNWQAVVLAIGVMVAAGTLFWKLVRVMARIQLPERRQRESAPPR
jgi:hypothetical protein